jgi:acylphosphatase
MPIGNRCRTAMTATVTTRFLVTGDVAAAHFPGWIRSHAAKLGLTSVVVARTDAGLEVQGSGPQEMIEALGIACSLGPDGVLVDGIIAQSNFLLPNFRAFAGNML